MTTLEKIEAAIQKAASDFPDGDQFACARAAVEAMREPSDRMLANFHGMQRIRNTRTMATSVWQAMIDAILAEK